MSTKTTIIIVGLMAVISLAAVSSIVALALAVGARRGRPRAVQTCADDGLEGGESAKEYRESHAPILPTPR